MLGLLLLQALLQGLEAEGQVDLLGALRLRREDVERERTTAQSLV